MLTLMAVVQLTKKSDLELNDHVACYTSGDTIDIYSETIREWKQIKCVKTFVDFKSAYLQLHLV